jgi:hypothetical protein
MKTLFGISILALGAIAASQTELAVQGRSNLGGTSTTIVGFIGGTTGWSLTGISSDVARVFDGTNRPVATVKIQDFQLGWNGQVFVSSIVSLPDGQTRIFASTPSTPPFFAGGRVELRRNNGTLRDSDPIVLI